MVGECIFNQLTPMGLLFSCVPLCVSGSLGRRRGLAQVSLFRLVRRFCSPPPLPLVCWVPFWLSGSGFSSLPFSLFARLGSLCVCCVGVLLFLSSFCVPPPRVPVKYLSFHFHLHLIFIFFFILIFISFAGTLVLPRCGGACVCV